MTITTNVMVTTRLIISNGTKGDEELGLVVGVDRGVTVEAVIVVEAICNKIQ